MYTYVYKYAIIYIYAHVYTYTSTTKALGVYHFPERAFKSKLENNNHLNVHQHRMDVSTPCISHSTVNEWTATTQNDMDEFHKTSVEWKKPDTKAYMILFIQKSNIGEMSLYCLILGNESVLSQIITIINLWARSCGLAA